MRLIDRRACALAGLLVLLPLAPAYGADVKPSEVKPSEVKPSEVKPSEVKPSNAKPSNAKPSNAKASDTKASDAKASEANPGLSKADRRVKAALDELKLKYQIDSDGDFRLKLNVGSQGRSQVVVIRSATEKVGDLEVRDIESPAMISQNDLTAAAANQLLVDSGRKRLGAWQVLKGQKNNVVLFCSRISASTDSATLQQVLLLTAMSADTMEKALTGKDQF
jgi:hypothetical protein